MANLQKNYCIFSGYVVLYNRDREMAPKQKQHREVIKMTKTIEIRYERKNPICADYEKFFITHNTDDDGNYKLIRQTAWGTEPVIKPNGTFDDENLARLVLDYIETKRGYEKCDEHLYFN